MHRQCWYLFSCRHFEEDPAACDRTCDTCDEPATRDIAAGINGAVGLPMRVSRQHPIDHCHVGHWAAWAAWRREPHHALCSPMNPDHCTHPQRHAMQDVSAEGRGVLAALAAMPATDKRATLIQLVGRWRALKVQPQPAGGMPDMLQSACLPAGIVSRRAAHIACAASSPEIACGSCLTCCQALRVYTAGDSRQQCSIGQGPADRRGGTHHRRNAAGSLPGPRLWLHRCNN